MNQVLLKQIYDLSKQLHKRTDTIHLFEILKYNANFFFMH